MAVVRVKLKSKQIMLKFNCSMERPETKIRLNFTEDSLLAFRYAYYVQAKPIISDVAYDEMERAYLDSDRASETSPIRHPGSDRESDYPVSVRALALYYRMAFHEYKKPVKYRRSIRVPTRVEGIQ